MTARIAPQRLALEYASMRNSYATLVRCADGTLCWCDILISHGGNDYHVIITYPDDFPFQRPVAFIVAPDLRPNTPHRYLDPMRTLCLFPTPFDETLSCTAGSVRGRVALWIFCYETWCSTGVWNAQEARH